MVTAAAVGVAVAAAAIVAVTIVNSQSVANRTRGVTTASEASLVTGPVVTGITAPLVVRIVSALRPSLVAIGTPSSGGALRTTGVVLPGGDLAVTSATAVGDANRVDIETASGQHREVPVLGRDTRSGVAVLSTGGGLTPAAFAAGGVEPGQLAIAACLCGVAKGDPPATVAVGDVRSVGTGVTLNGGTGLVDSIEADMPLGPAPWGGVLIDGQGQVVGVLDGRKHTASGRIDIFVPASLAVGVARELAVAHKVAHGWLGITCTDAPDDAGARIATVMTGSPAAAAGLHRGDVVAAVDSHPIDSLADLQASLYTSPPGTPVSVMLVRSGEDMMMTVTLASSPTG
jgi:putative serine protease PepD